MTEPSLRAVATLVAVFVLLAGCDRFTGVETRVARANSSLEAGEFQAALIDLHKALDAEPGNLDAQLLLVDVLSASGELQAARAQLDRAIEAGAPASATEYRQLQLLSSLADHEALRMALGASTTLSASQRDTFEGQLSLLENRPADALTAFDRALAADPAVTDAALGRIEALAALDRHEAAQQAVDALLERDPESGRAWLYKGSLTTRTADFAAAADAFSRATEYSRGMSREQRVQAHVARLESQLAAGQLEAARASLPQLEAVAGGAPIVSLVRARISLAGGSATEAVNDLRRFTQAAPQHLGGRLLLVAALQEQGSTEQAFAEAARNVAEFPANDEPRLALANVQLRMGRVADAEDTLRPLVTQSPPNSLANAVLAELRVRSGNAAAGISLLQQNLAEHPEDARLQLQLAGAYLSSGDARRALQILDSVEDRNLAAARDRLHVIATAALQGPAAVEQELDAAIARHPQDVELQLMAAAYDANTGRVDQARERLQEALRQRPADPVLAMTLARLELLVGRIAEAEALTRSALDKSPNDTAAMILMAAIAGQRGQEADVDAWLNRARLANPGTLDVSLALARRAAVRGDAAEARSILFAAVNHSPQNPGARAALAEFIASQGQHREALAELLNAARLHPDSPLIPFTMARIQLATEETDAARNSLRQALKLAPGWLPAATALADLEARSGNLSAALEVVREVRRTNPSSSTSHVLEGEVYLAAQRPAPAAAAFAAAYRQAPGSGAAIRALQARMQARMQARIDAPEAELVDWIARSPMDSGARRALGDFYLMSGSNDRAIEQFEHVVAARPLDGIALNNLAWLYQQKGDARALSTAEKAYAAAPRVAAVADTYGWILVQSGRATEGLKALTEAAELAPDDGQIQFHFAYAMAEAGQRGEAVEVLRKLLGKEVRFDSLQQARELLSSLEAG